MHPKFYATLGTVYEKMLKNASDSYSSFLYGTNRCVGIWMHFWPAQVPTNWRGGDQACLLGYRIKA